MKGYWRNAAATSATIDAAGFLHTGDVAYVDADGNFFIVDRVKELINVNAMQVSTVTRHSLLRNDI
jgi:long-subunit acyl-CoA synthetase (AMP-forming)